MRMAVYRILIAVPFSHATVTTAAPAAVQWVARAFDAMMLRNRYMNAVCTRWVSYSANRLLELARKVASLPPVVRPLSTVALKRIQRAKRRRLKIKTKAGVRNRTSRTRLPSNARAPTARARR